MYYNLKDILICKIITAQLCAYITRNDSNLAVTALAITRSARNSGHGHGKDGSKIILLPQ